MSVRSGKPLYIEDITRVEMYFKSGQSFVENNTGVEIYFKSVHPHLLWILLELKFMSPYLMLTT